jgi:MarR family transcriptional regulator, temperature-dependent positive regulator of motility
MSKASTASTSSRARKNSQRAPVMPVHDEPGHLIRRAQQLAVACFHEVHGRHATPIQYAILRTLQDHPGIDQVTLAQKIALDTSTAADIAARLETKGWIERKVMPRRQRSLSLTTEGADVLQGLQPGIERVYQAVLKNLQPAEQDEFMRLLRKLVQL